MGDLYEALEIARDHSKVVSGGHQFQYYPQKAADRPLTCLIQQRLPLLIALQKKNIGTVAEYLQCICRTKMESSGTNEVFLGIIFHHRDKLCLTGRMYH